MVQDHVYKEMLENMYEGIYFVDNNRKITFWNKGAEIITGFLASEVIGSHCHDNILNHVDNDGNKLCINGCPLQKTILDGDKRETKVYLSHKKGHRVAVLVKTIPLFEGDEVIGAAEIFVDDREKIKLLENIEQLKELAITDQLTGLPNRRFAEEYFKSKINDYNNFRIPFGIAFIDIDYFKEFNDTYGHDIGDEVLKMVSEAFKSGIRMNDIIARWGGEEFIAVFVGVDDDSLRLASEKIRMLIETSKLILKDKELSVTISLGASLYRSGESIEKFVKRTDENMYLAKKTGRNKIVVD